MTAALLLAAAEAVPLLGILIWLLIFAVIVWVVFLILGMLPLPEPVKTIITVVVGLILLIVLVSRLGLI